MSRPLRYFFVLALSLCGIGFHSGANSQTKIQKKPSTGSVSGRVTLHGKGAAGIVVGVRTSDFSSPGTPAIKGTTDADGHYRIIGIPAGNYTVSPMAPSYVITDLVPVRGRGRSLLLAEGEDVQDVDFSLERGGVITGRVTDASGRPIVEERLTLIPVDQNKQNVQNFGTGPTNGAQTDDRGVYRIYGVAPGQYKISIGRDDDNYSTVGVGRVAYQRTFYPGTTELAEAGVVEVTEGSEATNIDITLGPTLPGFVASGKVVDGETGQPVPALRLGLRRLINNDYTGVNASVSSNNQGEFRLENVIAGKYGIVIMPLPGVEIRAEGLTFDVVDQDVTGLLVKTLKGLSISGNVVIEGKSDSGLSAKLADLRLYAYVRGEGSLPGFGRFSSINPDGSFRISGLSPGNANLSLGSQGGPIVNFSILRVERDGVALPRGLELNMAEQQVTGVKVVLKYGTGSIRGEVKLEDGPAPVGSRLMVWIKKVGEAGSNLRPYTPDLRGHFLIEGIAAGDYELNANLNIPGREPPRATQTITVTDGTVSDVVITIDLKPKPGQPLAP